MNPLQVHQDCDFKTDFAHELISHIKEKVDEQVKVRAYFS